jgi:anti-sigma B factor antagonist
MSMPTQTAAPRLTLDIEHKGTTTIVRCHGKLVSGVTDVLYSNVSKLIPDSKRIILDLTDLSFMDSMGLGTLMRLYVSARGSGCTLELINIGKRIRELLELTNIWSVFATIGEHGIKL